MTKEFKTIDEQINLLKSRGLIIENESLAKEFLLKNNYYRISGYTLTLREKDVFYKGITLENVIDIYEFDKNLRNILLYKLEIIEVQIKSIYAYEFAQHFSPLDYLNENIFTNSEKYREIMKKTNEQKAIRLKHEAYLQHYENELHEELPIWVYVDLLTFSDISNLYEISEEKFKTAVAVHYNLNYTKSSKIIAGYLHHLSNIRNLCAHGSRLYNRLFIRKPNLNKKELSLLRKDKKGFPDNTHLYGFFFILKRLLSEEEFNQVKESIITLQKKYRFVDMRYYGFGANWYNDL